MAKTNGNGNGDQDDVKETSSWHCKCGAMGKCVKGDEKLALALHWALGKCVQFDGKGKKRKK